MIFIFAAILAVGFSAFTPHKKTVDTFYYQEDGEWKPINVSPCPLKQRPVCIVQTPDGPRQIFQTASTTLPVYGPLNP